MATTGTQTLRARREAVVNAHIEAEAVHHDISAALATFHRPRYEVPAVGAIADGPEAVHGLLGQVLGAFGLRLSCDELAPWAGIAPTGNPVAVESACIFVFEGDRLVCEKVYFDHATILRQIGA